MMILRHPQSVDLSTEQTSNVIEVQYDMPTPPHLQGYLLTVQQNRYMERQDLNKGV